MILFVVTNRTQLFVNKYLTMTERLIYVISLIIIILEDVNIIAYPDCRIYLIKPYFAWLKNITDYIHSVIDAILDFL